MKQIILENVYIADIYMCVSDHEQIVQKNVVIYKNNNDGTYRIINLSDISIDVGDKVSYLYDGNVSDYYFKNLKNFYYMNGAEVSKTLRYVKKYCNI